MSRRVQIDVAQKRRTTTEAAIRAKQEAKAQEHGWPLSPDQYMSNNRKLWALWQKYGEQLFEARLLSFADGAALLAYCKAKLAGDKERAKSIAELTWGERTPFPEPVVLDAGQISLPDFLEEVHKSRATFASCSQCSNTCHARYELV